MHTQGFKITCFLSHRAPWNVFWSVPAPVWPGPSASPVPSAASPPPLLSPSPCVQRQSKSMLIWTPFSFPPPYPLPPHPPSSLLTLPPHPPSPFALPGLHSLLVELVSGSLALCQLLSLDCLPPLSSHRPTPQLTHLATDREQHHTQERVVCVVFSK